MKIQLVIDTSSPLIIVTNYPASSAMGITSRLWCRTLSSGNWKCPIKVPSSPEVDLKKIPFKILITARHILLAQDLARSPYVIGLITVARGAGGGGGGEF